MKLGAFSISIAVKDLKSSRSFYEKLGFTVFTGEVEKNYLILKSGDTLIGLFQDMFPNNILTFNPGWDQSASNIESFDDVRVIQSKLKRAGVETGDSIDPNSTGPANFMITDTDGNVILFDQHR